MYGIWKIMCFLNIKACQHILLYQIHKIMIFKKASYDPFNKFLQVGKVNTLTEEPIKMRHNFSSVQWYF